MSDLSSADEDAQRRLKKKSRVSKLNASVHSASPQCEDLAELAVWLKVPATALPNLKTVRELVQEQKHLALQTDCEIAKAKLACVSTSSSQQNRNVDEVKAEHMRQFQHDPFQMEAFLRRRDALSVPKFYVVDDRHHSLNQEEIHRQLSENKLQLFCLTADFESKLLAQAAPHKLKDFHGEMRQFPVCRYKDKCVGSVIKIPGLTERIQLTALMFPHEYDQFLKTGVSPAQNRPCILCCRYILVDWSVFI